MRTIFVQGSSFQVRNPQLERYFENNSTVSKSYKRFKPSPLGISSTSELVHQFPVRNDDIVHSTSIGMFNHQQFHFKLFLSSGFASHWATSISLSLYFPETYQSIKSSFFSCSSGLWCFASRKVVPRKSLVRILMNPILLPSMISTSFRIVSTSLWYCFIIVN